MARVSPEANVAFLFLWILFNIHLFYRARGKELYINNGFLIVVVANFCLWFVVHNLVFDQPEKCGGPTAYCGTISCMSGNLYFQGYVFMFVVLTSNAYIHLRHIAAGQVEASRDRSKWGSETEVPIFSGCTHGLRAECGLRRDTDKTYDGQDHGISWWFYVAFGIFAGFLSAVIGALVAASMDLDSHTTPLYAFCVGFVLAVCYSTFLGLRRILSWLMPVTYFSSDRALGDPASTDRVLHPYFSKIDMAERLISFGVVCTTLTAIMPTIATDPRERQHLSDTMSTLHTFGVAIGVTTMAAGACHRTVTFFRLVFPCRPSKVDAPQRRVNCLPCTWVRNSHIIGYPEWVAGVAVDAVIFVAFFTALVSFVYYTSHRESTPTPRSHYCVLYESEDRCHGDGLDLDALGLTPWPCIWSNSSLVHCFNPNCKIEHNQNEVISEFWVLTMAIVVVMCHQTAASEVLDADPNKAANVWHDKYWFANSDRQQWIPAGNCSYCKLCCATSAHYDWEGDNIGEIQLQGGELLGPCQCCTPRLEVAGLDQLRGVQNSPASQTVWEAPTLDEGNSSAASHDRKPQVLSL